MEDERPAYKSYEEMYQKEYHTVYSYIRRIISGNDAVVEDLTQEVFFVAYQKWERMLVHPNPTGFLIVVAQNKIKKWFREKKPLYVDDAQLLELLSENGRERDEKDDFFMVDLYSTVEKALSNAELDILRYYYEYGYSSAEMAGRLGITENCFKVRVSRMKAKLKKSVGFLFCLMAVILGTVFGPPMGQCQAAQVKPQYQVQVQASGLSYGQRLGESVLTGSVTDPQGRPVEGSFRWLKEDQLMKQVGTVFYTAVFEEQMQGDFSDASEEKEEKTKPVFFSVTVPVDVQKAVPDVEAPQISLLKSQVYDGDLLEEAVKPEGGSASWTSSPQSEDPDAVPSLVEGRFVLKEPKKTLETGTCEFSVLFLPEQETLFEQVEVKGYSIEVQPRPVQMELFFLKDDEKQYQKVEPSYGVPKISDKNVTPKDRMIAEKIRQIIAADYDDPELKVNDMADRLCYTSAYLCMVYKKVTGMTINDSLNLYRIEKGRQLLADGFLKVAEIAARVGYSNENYFSKVFKKYEGISPKEYQEQRWKK